jgi:AraC-like DNA-binding protein
MALLIDTEGVDPRQRASHFLDAMMASPLPATDASHSHFEADDFRARFYIKPLGDAYLGEVLATGLQLKRSRREIDRSPSGQVLVALLKRGSCREDFEDREPILFHEPGDLLLLDFDGPQTATFDGLMSATCAFIPRRRLRPFLSNDSELRPLLIRPRDELHGLIKACLVASAEAQNLTSAAADGALGALASLAMIAHGVHCETTKGLHGSFLHARRVRAQRFIEERCIDPRLDAERVADHLGISLRSLHFAFEATGASVGARILSARLRRARDLLVRFPKRSILDIALDCGFENLATFYRGLSRAYGHPPGDVRKSCADKRLA